MMEHTGILILGAGKSSSHLIDHLRSCAEEKNWRLTIADKNPSAIARKISEDHTRIAALDIENVDARGELIGQHDVVISLLPAILHDIIAKDCLRLSKHFFTASYASAWLREVAAEVQNRGLAFVTELGLDPGLDHMSAVADIQRIKQAGGQVLSFKSHAGGLIAPESNSNPWHYKFTWNPYNVVRAGAAGALYLSEGKQRLVPYHRLFASSYKVDFPGVGMLEGYPNRDSLKYRSLYGLQGAHTILRGTLRRPGFCAAWQQLVEFGLTSDSVLLDCSDMSFSDFFAVAGLLQKLDGSEYASSIWEKIAWLGAEDGKKLDIQESSTPAEVLEYILLEKWKLAPDDRDMVLMVHDISYRLDGQNRRSRSWLSCKGTDSINTAMSRLVGLPLALGVETFLDGLADISGLVLPTDEKIYRPVLAKLAQLGIRFEHEDAAVD